MTEYQVLVPDESFVLIDAKRDGLPSVVVVNAALVGFEPKVVFDYQLSIIIDFEDLADNGMPSVAEREVVEPFVDQLDQQLKGDVSKPNALFLARETWNGTRQLLYRVHEPEVVHKYLQHLIETKTYPRDFDYRMAPDPTWELSKWLLELVAKD